eukprot:SAG31_NODE_13318_length_877_cov_1.244216_2_plen_55_part_01
MMQNKTKHLDIGYDGVFSRHYSAVFCKLMKTTKPDWVYIDDEAFGEGWNSWKFKV